MITANFVSNGDPVGKITNSKIVLTLNDISSFELTVVGLGIKEVNSKYHVSYLPKSEIKIYDNGTYVVGGFIEELEYVESLRTLIIRGRSYEVLLTLNYTGRNIDFIGNTKTAENVWKIDTNNLLTFSTNNGTPYVYPGKIDNVVTLGGGTSSKFRSSRETLWKALKRFCSGLGLDYWVSTNTSIGYSSKWLNINQKRGDTTRTIKTFGPRSPFKITGFKKNIYNLATDVTVLGGWDGKYQDENSATATDTIASRLEYGQIDLIFQDPSLNEPDGTLGLAQTIANNLRDAKNSVGRTMKFSSSDIYSSLQPGDTVRIIDDKYGIDEVRRIKRIRITSNTSRLPQYSIELFDANKNTADSIMGLTNKLDESNIVGTGAVNTYKLTFDVSATNADPATLDIYVPSIVAVQDAVTLKMTVTGIRYYDSGSGTIVTTSAPTAGGTLSGDWGYSATYTSGGVLAGVDGDDLVNTSKLALSPTKNTLTITPASGQKHGLKISIIFEVYATSG